MGFLTSTEGAQTLVVNVVRGRCWVVVFVGTWRVCSTNWAIAGRRATAGEVAGGDIGGTGGGGVAEDGHAATIAGTARRVGKGAAH